MSLEITYWTGMSGNIPVAECDISSETCSISGTSAQSGAAPSNARVVSIVALVAARFAIGTNPAASAASPYIAAGERLWRKIEPGQKIAGITA